MSRSGGRGNRSAARKQTQGQQAAGHQVQRSARGGQPGAGFVEMTEAYAGLLPHPRHLAQIEEIVPGAAGRIIDEFVAQGEHRRIQESAVVAGSESRAHTGQRFGLVILLTGIIAGALIGIVADAKYGAVTVVGALTCGAVIYVVGGRPPRAE